MYPLPEAWRLDFLRVWCLGPRPGFGFIETRGLQIPDTMRTSEAKREMPVGPTLLTALTARGNFNPIWKSLHYRANPEERDKVSGSEEISFL